jgi:hypothetical protein
LAVQFGLARPKAPMVRLVAWTLLLYWAANKTWQSVFDFSFDAGVRNHTAAQHFERALAVGLQRATGVASRMVQPPWAAVRQQCVLTLLQAGRFAGWPELIEVVDEHIATIEDKTERERFVFVAQAILMLSEDNDGRGLVRAELRAEEVKLGMNDDALDAIITEVRHAL